MGGTYYAKIQVAPELVADPLVESMNQCAEECGYGTKDEVYRLYKLFESKAGTRHLVSSHGFSAILKKHGITSDELLSRLFSLFSLERLCKFEGVVAALSVFCNPNRLHEAGSDPNSF